MIDAAQSALRFIEGRSRRDLDRDDMLVFALIVGMRNRVIHAYFDVDLNILWSTVTEALPSLVAQLRTIAGHSAK